MFNVHIRNLLINTSSMIYICCIKYGGEVGICVLVVGNDKLNVGEDELNDVAASSEVAEDETCGKG
jgi:hypothetical protein